MTNLENRAGPDLASRAQVHAALGEEHRLAIVDALRLSDLTPSELQDLTGLGSNLLAFHLGVLDDAGLIERQRSQGDARRRYVTLRAAALEIIPGPIEIDGGRVLFVCSRNAARSQLAAALWCDRTGVEADSAGTEPADEIDVRAVEVAQAHGLRIEGAPRGYEDVSAAPSLVVSVCDRSREAGLHWDVTQLHWSVPDPAGGEAADYERAYDDLERRIDRLAAAASVVGSAVTSDSVKRLTAEFLGTSALLSAIVGSGIVTATDGPASVQLFQHAVAVGAALVALIFALGPVSGAHFNPAVTIADWWFGGLPGRTAAGYVAAQITGALAGTVATNLMFDLPAVAMSSMPRDGVGLIAGEALATAGLLIVIFALVHTDRTAAVPGAVGAWIGAAIFFTASASFANPAVTLARVVTDTYTGIAPGSVPGFLLGQAVGVVAAVGLVTWLYHPTEAEAHRVVVPHDETDDSTARGE